MRVYAYSNEISLHCCICGKHELQPHCEIVNMRHKHACVCRRFYCRIGVDTSWFYAVLMLQHVLQALGGNKTAANCFITHAQIINTQDVDKK